MTWTHGLIIAANLGACLVVALGAWLTIRIRQAARGIGTAITVRPPCTIPFDSEDEQDTVARVLMEVNVCSGWWTVSSMHGVVMGRELDVRRVVRALARSGAVDIRKGSSGTQYRRAS